MEGKADTREGGGNKKNGGFRLKHSRCGKKNGRDYNLCLASIERQKLGSLDGRRAMTEEEKQIVVMLAKEAARNQPIDGLPIWRAVLWAMFHPKQWARELGRFWALSNAIHAIERGEHRQHSPAKDD